VIVVGLQRGGQYRLAGVCAHDFHAEDLRDRDVLVQELQHLLFYRCDIKILRVDQLGGCVAGRSRYSRSAIALLSSFSLEL